MMNSPFRGRHSSYSLRRIPLGSLWKEIILRGEVLEKVDTIIVKEDEAEEAAHTFSDFEEIANSA